MTFEAPPGLQHNLQRTYESLMHKEFVERGNQSRAQLLFVLSWFHAVLQERLNPAILALVWNVGFVACAALTINWADWGAAVPLLLPWLPR